MPGVESDRLALLLAVGVPLLLRLIDFLLPADHTFKFVRRYAARLDEPPDEGDDE